MTQVVLDAMPGMPGPRVIRPRSTDARVGTIYGHSRGGIDDLPTVENRPPRQDFTQQNFTGTMATNDKLITRVRGLVYRRPYYMPPPLGAGDLSWTAAGPAKDLPTTRGNRNFRPLVGGGHRDMWGQHSDFNTIGQNQLEGKSRMRPGKQNQLTVQRYRGQSYSATTQLVGQ